MRVHEIRSQREFYDAIHDYSRKVWHWGAEDQGEDGNEPTPDELLELLEQRIEWVKAHKKAVDTYFRKLHGPTWVRVIDGSKTDVGR